MVYVSYNYSKNRELRKETFVNRIGQIINPGEKVLFIGRSGGYPSFGAGIFEGVIYGQSSYSNDDTKKIVAVKVIKTKNKNYYNNSAILPLKKVFKADTVWQDLQEL